VVWRLPVYNTVLNILTNAGSSKNSAWREIWQQREVDVVGLAQSVEWADLRPAEGCLADANVTTSRSASA
jgi:hypothetical protein